MLLKLFALFVVIPLIELALLLLLAARTSVPMTLCVVVLTGIAGAVLARAQGFRTLRQIQADLSRGKLPTNSLLDAAMIFCAGALLLTPGLLTDALGFSLLLPFCRQRYRRQLSAWLRRNFQVQSFKTSGPQEQTKVIDSYVVDRPPIVEPPSDEKERP